MKYKGVKMLVLMCVVLVGIAWVGSEAASAHKELTSGDYAIEMGFNQEPALQGDLNGLFLSVTNSKTDTPVTGLGSTLKAEIAFGDAKRTLTLEPQEGRDGVYIAWVVPTEVGDYTWRVFGTIEGNAVDVSATSGPDSFNAVEPKSDVSFPGTGSAVATAAGSGSDVSNQLIAMRDQADSAASSASTALWIALIGVVLGFVGIILGGVAVWRR
jgi:hypothetical protein